ncbi:hypothetical protein [Catenovulum sediminis]|uniref:hypothetical protein n=1 Tax=Catenovulum sediminis TaxID=1740262 RepID=UPI001180FAE0|nr:hypothetical protein [Catenovulum sediminis]
MTNISSTRLNEVFRALSQSKTSSSNLNHSKKIGKSVTNEATVSGGKRLISTLKQQLINRLSVLDEHSEKYQVNATTVLVEEVLAWEFGLQIVNVPNYGELKQNMVSSFLKHPEMSKQLAEMFTQLVKNK